MFGGIAFLVHGNMSVGVNKELLIARVGADTEAIALARPHARVCMFTRRPMKGWVEVPPEGYADDANLDWFVEAGVRFARSLPRK